MARKQNTNDFANMLDAEDAAIREAIASGSLKNTQEEVVENAVEGSKLRDFWGKVSPKLKTGWNWARQHPGHAIGYGLLGAGNIAGLFDNSKIFGQLAGAGAGVGIPFAVNAIAKKPIFGVPGKVMFGLGGGALGSLFDVLMAKKEQEQEQQMYQQYQQYQGQY